MAILMFIVAVSKSNVNKNYQFNITTQTITRNSYTVIKFFVRKHTVYNGIQGVIHHIIDYYYLLIALAVTLLLIRYLRSRNSIIRVKIAVNTKILDGYEKIDIHVSDEKSSVEEYSNVYVLARSLLKYSSESILRLFRALCGSRMKIVLLIEKYPSSKINSIIKIIKDNMLEKCIHLKYVSNVKETDLNIIDIDEIMSILSQSIIKSDTKYVVSNIRYAGSINTDENSNKRSGDHGSDNIVIFGRKKKYIINKELYDELKIGIDVKELRRKYDSKIYSLLMDMYNDGIIIFNGNKMILVE